MARVRGRWFVHLRQSAETHLLSDLLRLRLPHESWGLLEHAHPDLWYEDVHELAVYRAIQSASDGNSVHCMTRQAWRLALQSPWLFEQVGLRVTDAPEDAFHALSTIWSVLRQDAGEVRCVGVRSRQAITELRGYLHAHDASWQPSWLGLHEALLRHVGFAGLSRLDEDASDSFIVRARTDWAGGLSHISTPHLPVVRLPLR